MIIHCVGEVIGGNAVGFQQNLVDVVFRNGEVSLYQVLVLELVLGGSGGAEAKDPGAAHGQLSLNFFQAPVPPDRPGAVIAEIHLLLLLLLTHGGKLFFCAEAGVSIALFHQLLGVDVINLRPLALPVGTISAHVPHRW